MSNPVPATVTSPEMLDAALAQVQTVLENQLSWLTTAYGKIEKREVKDPEGRKVVFPSVYAGGTEYINLLPDEHLGNYSYIEVLDSQAVVWRPRSYSEFTADVAIIFWFDFRTVYPADYQERSVDHVKYEVLSALAGSTFPSIRLTITSISERAENIYRGFSASEIETQFLMRPYGGFRLDAKLIYKVLC